MSVLTVLPLIGARLELANPAPQDPPARIFTNPAEAVSMEDFPAIVLSLAPQVEHVWSRHAWGDGRHDYTVVIYVFVGSRQTGLEELHARVLPWAQAISEVLFADMTLGNAVEFVGSKTDDGLFRYTIGPIRWGDGEYFGLKILLPVTETHVQEME